ncbi:MAG TPA: rRNA maturation RNase YbeY [Caulobacteraceae bacterium]|jgi:probable rRNA maturation factor
MIVVEIEDEAWRAIVPNVQAVVQEAAGAALGGDRREATVLLTDDGALRDLNARFLGKDRPTNVLAFPDVDPKRLGDVAVAFATCASEAESQGKSLADHLRHLVVHGVLHLIGYDHQSEADAERMEGLERRLLANMNIADPYA